jgi:DNA-binding Lrp family transcriptional regulator
MSDGLRLDELDLMILSILTKDARSSLKEIAKRCRLTSSAVLRRIERLKQEGVIMGTRFVLRASGGTIYAHSFGNATSKNSTKSHQPSRISGE